MTYPEIEIVNKNDDEATFSIKIKNLQKNSSTRIFWYVSAPGGEVLSSEEFLDEVPAGNTEYTSDTIDSYYPPYEIGEKPLKRYFERDLLYIIQCIIIIDNDRYGIYDYLDGANLHFKVVWQGRPYVRSFNIRQSSSSGDAIFDCKFSTVIPEATIIDGVIYPQTYVELFAINNDGSPYRYSEFKLDEFIYEKDHPERLKFPYLQIDVSDVASGEMSMSWQMLVGSVGDTAQYYFRLTNSYRNLEDGSEYSYTYTSPKVSISIIGEELAKPILYYTSENTPYEYDNGRVKGIIRNNVKITAYYWNEFANALIVMLNFKNIFIPNITVVQGQSFTAELWNNVLSCVRALCTDVGVDVPSSLTENVVPRQVILHEYVDDVNEALMNVYNKFV